MDKSTPDVHTPEEGLPQPEFKVGDKVQVTVGGVDQYADGATVLGFSEDRAWVFIDQSSAAAKLEEVTLLEAASAPSSTEDRPKIPVHLLRQQEESPLRGARKAVFPLSDGDVVLTYQDGISDASLKRLKKYLEIFLDEQIELAQDSKSN